MSNGFISFELKSRATWSLSARDGGIFADNLLKKISARFFCRLNFEEGFTLKRGEVVFRTARQIIY